MLPRGPGGHQGSHEGPGSPPGFPQGAACLQGGDARPGGHMPQTSKPRAGASSHPAQGRVVLMAGVFFLKNHFYKNQPVAQLQQGRAWGPAQPLPLPLFPTPTLDPRDSTVSRGSPAPPPSRLFQESRVEPTQSHTDHHLSLSHPSSFSHLGMSVSESFRDKSSFHLLGT